MKKRWFNYIFRLKKPFLIVISSLLLTITYGANVHLECCGVSEVLCSIDLLRMYLRNHKAGNFCCIMSVEVLGWKEWCCTLIETAEQDIQFCLISFFFVHLPLFSFMSSLYSILWFCLILMVGFLRSFSCNIMSCVLCSKIDQLLQQL